MAYIILAALGLGPALLAIQQSRGRALLALFFVAGSGVMLADWVALGWFHLYAYTPGLTANPRADNMWGEFLGETLFVPGLCVSLRACLPGWKGTLTGVAVVTVTEILFVRLGVFHRNGWSPWYTPVAFALFLPLVGLFAEAAERTGLRRGWPLVVTRVALSCWGITLLSMFMRANALLTVRPHLTPNFDETQSLGRFLNYGPFGVPVGYWVLAGPRQQRPYRLGLGILFEIAVNYALSWWGLIAFRPPWEPMTDGMALGLVFLMALWLDDAIAARSRVIARPK